MTNNSKNSAWKWIPSLYYAEGIPYVVVMLVSGIMYKRMGVSNTDLALYTSWFYLPWVIKPLWSPLVDILRTKKFWILTMQLLIGAALGAVALSIPAPNFFKLTVGLFWLMAFSSATHDIAADGFYMLGLSKHDQAWFVGIRSTFYRLAMITGQGLLIILAGFLESHTGLDSIQVQVTAKPLADYQASPPVQNDFLPLDGDLRLICDNGEDVIIPIQVLEKSKKDSIIASISDYNTMMGFYAKDTRFSENESTASLWQRYISIPLEQFLRKHFGQNQQLVQSNMDGNIAVLSFYLSKQPEENEEIIVNFGRKSGNKNISLLEGFRFIFTSENWNSPALAVCGIDSKLDREATALFQARAGNIPFSWSVTFFILALLFVIFFIYHKRAIPDIEAKDKTASASQVFKEFFITFRLFFKKQHIGIAVLFILFYRLGEAQLVKLASPFLLDAQEVGGLGLSTGEVGFVYGTVGIIMLTLGGLLGGFLAARNGLKYWIWWMALAMNLPNAVYIYLSAIQPDSFITINIAVAIEQFGYGFGFTAFMLYMISVAEGEYKTAHFAIATAFMALGMMIPGMFSGWLQEIIGYEHFFIWVVIATIPGFVLIPYLGIDPQFGKKEE